MHRRPTRLPRAVVAALTLLLAACASRPALLTSSAYGADFGGYHTFWVEPPDVTAAPGVQGIEGAAQLFARAARTQMEQRGYASAEGPDEADLLVRVQAFSREALYREPSTVPTFVTRPESQFDWVAGYRTDLVRANEGVVVVQLLDGERGRVVWEGAGIRRLRKREAGDPTIDGERALAEVYRGYPYLAGSAEPVAEAGESAFDEALHHANRGDAGAQFLLASMYLGGYGAPRDAREARRWFRGAAEDDSPLAQYSLGWMLVQGSGGPADVREGAGWLRRAAESGIAAAQADLALLHLRGEGVPRDDDAAARWYRRAAEQGLAAAQFRLGLMLEQGRGVRIDRVEAYAWHLRAADAGQLGAAGRRDLLAEELTAPEREAGERIARAWSPVAAPVRPWDER
ncbi:MAG: DUF4136 domain-containing protein [Planctomycetota bacterium]